MFEFLIKSGERVDILCKIMPSAHLSNIGLLLKDKDGDGRGCEPVMKIDSDLGVWLPPWPLEGGTPTRHIGGVLAVAKDAATPSSAWLNHMTLS